MRFVSLGKLDVHRGPNSAGIRYIWPKVSSQIRQRRWNPVVDILRANSPVILVAVLQALQNLVYREVPRFRFRVAIPVHPSVEKGAHCLQLIRGLPV